jgi:hypothetical protein
LPEPCQWEQAAPWEGEGVCSIGEALWGSSLSLASLSTTYLFCSMVMANEVCKYCVYYCKWDMNKFGRQFILNYGIICERWLQYWYCWSVGFVKHVVEMASCGKFHDDQFKHVILRLFSQQFEGLQCWYYWCERFRKYPIEMTSDRMINTHHFRHNRFRYLSSIKVIT